MANPKRRKTKRTTTSTKAKAKQEDMINVPRSAIPHMFNQDMLDWLKAIFEGQKEVYKVLEEIRELLKE